MIKPKKPAKTANNKKRVKKIRSRIIRFRAHSGLVIGLDSIRRDQRYLGRNINKVAQFLVQREVHEFLGAKDQIVILKLSMKLTGYLEELLASGLHGMSINEVAERLLCESLDRRFSSPKYEISESGAVKELTKPLK